MSFECTLLSRSSRPNDIVSYRAKACRLEPPIRHVTNSPSDRTQLCPFDPDCRRVNDGRDLREPLDNTLAAAYGERFIVIQSEPSTSVVIRSEQQFHGEDLSRLAQRRHFAELLCKRGNNPNSYGSDCTVVRADVKDRLGEYLGFVDLRHRFNKAPLAFGLLVAPARLRDDPFVSMVGGDYGHMFGAHSFRSTVYCMQDPGTIGARCAQMCMIMALGMLADRGAEVIGSFTLTHLNWFLKWMEQESKAHNVLDSHASETPLATFPEKGMSPRQICRVLNSAYCGVSAHRIQLPPDAAAATPGDQSIRDRELLRIVEAYVAANCPIIAAVNTQSWRDPGDNRLRDAEPHAVTIVGLRNSTTGEPVSLIVHDPASQPYFECSTKYFTTAATKYRRDNCFHLVAVTDRSLMMPAVECLRDLRGSFDCHLFDKYFRSSHDADFRIRLLHSESIAGVVLPWLDDPQRLGVLDHILDGRRYWCVMGLTRGRAEYAWLFDAASLRPRRTALSRHRHRLRVFGPQGRDVELSSFDETTGRWVSRRI